jgi:hypothetical protein
MFPETAMAADEPMGLLKPSANHPFLAWKVISLQEHTQLGLMVQDYPEGLVEMALLAPVREALAEIARWLILDLLFREGTSDLIVLQHGAPYGNGQFYDSLSGAKSNWFAREVVVNDFTYGPYLKAVGGYKPFPAPCCNVGQTQLGHHAPFTTRIECDCIIGRSDQASVMMTAAS